MTSIRKAVRLLTILAALCAGFATRAEAIPIVNVDPTEQAVIQGQSFDVDIILDTEGQLLGGLSLLLSFDGSLLAGTAYALQPEWLFGYDLGQIFAAGPLEITHDGRFTLVTVKFQALGSGVSPFDLSVLESDGFGEITTRDERVAVPEPGLMALLTTAVAAVGVRRRTRRRN